jgi:hypothetical protein
MYTLISDVDADLRACRWTISRNSSGKFYAMRNTHPDGRRRPVSKKLHRVILERVLGRKLDRSEQVDHINGDSLDNRRENLRLASALENSRNAKKRVDNSSGFRGVCKHHSIPGRWKAQINDGSGRRTYLGHFASPGEAAAAYDRAALEHHKDFARLNFPTETPPVTQETPLV